jgi:hypothetical protein
MSATKRRSVAESVFNRNQRREAEISDALKQEAARHAAVVKNMHRLRALRLAREEKSKEQPPTEDNTSTPTTGGRLTIKREHNVNFR